MFNIGDYVSRNKYNNDCLFKIIDIKNNTYYLSGVNIRLLVTSEISDLKKEDEIREQDDTFIEAVEYKNDYFYLTPTILHIDSSEDYLKRCLNLYKKNKLNAYGVKCLEKDVPNNISKYLNDVKPDIVVITGHDFYSKKNNTYQNSENYIKSVKIARDYEKSSDKLKIIAGACQSNFEGLIKSGANFASSPKRINIHALDPAIIATKLALTESTKKIDLIKVLNETKCGPKGIGGLECNGSMFVGYPK
jgi:spore coat assembly protein